ncbi:hypothetical protein HG15A2_40960 [Adhaeretor mobilis]|uniref:Uncharacterized protein n=1 Tax=Adhaeretor mobilis TaxID=1930276 RepID=A0A517N0U9_9BACT|nr:hypothetical protein HG15A2_40960 [Adhaeretor mobilis]
MVNNFRTPAPAASVDFKSLSRSVLARKIRPLGTRFWTRARRCAIGVPHVSGRRRVVAHNLTTKPAQANRRLTIPDQTLSQPPAQLCGFAHEIVSGWLEMGGRLLEVSTAGRYFLVVAAKKMTCPEFNVW